MKKFIAALCTAALTIGMVFAANSPDAGLINGGKFDPGVFENPDDAAKVWIEVTGSDVTNDEVTQAAKDLGISADYTVYAVADAHLKWDGDLTEDQAKALVTWPASIIFDVTGITADSDIKLLHKGAQGWEEIKDAKAGAGTITGSFADLSPVAVLINEKAAESGSTSSSSTSSSTSSASGDGSPKSGEPAVMAVVAGVALLAVAGMVITAKRRED